MTIDWTKPIETMDGRPARVLSEAQTELARHALGLPNKRRRSYRNHFVVGEGGADHDEWVAMTRNGFAALVRRGGALTGGDDLFRLTLAGAQLATNPGESLDPEDFPQSRKAIAKAGL